MSFQGDVGGIGLADLLQSLARGREGVVLLHSREDVKATLGVQGGLVHLLPEADEDAEYWRNRARQAWARDPEFRIDSLRMGEIARAQRIENLWRMLDSESVHFRFTPGPMPTGPTHPTLSAGEPGTARKGPRRDAVWCAGMPVENLLLEYARLKDEGQEAAKWFWVGDDAVIVAMCASMPVAGLERFYEEVDGNSNMIEIGDRLGWPRRQVRIVVFSQLQRGTLRLAQPQEVFGLAHRELVEGNFARAASRLCAWCEVSLAGPIHPAEAEVLSTEWQAGRLQPALRAMPIAPARTLLRRIDLAHANPMTAVERWTELADLHKSDPQTSLHLMIAQIRSAADPNLPSMRDMLAVARRFVDAKRPLRAGAILRVAAARMPETPSVRLEVGLIMLSGGLVDEGGPWILDAARSFVQGGEAEKAIAPLRALIDASPAHRDARRLLARARAHTVQRTLVRKNSLVTLAILLALSIGALVTYQSGRRYDERLDQVRALVSEPREALALLDSKFAEDTSTRVADLRRQLEERKKLLEDAERTAWTDRYRDAQLECTLGDPLLGLQRALELPPPPIVSTEDVGTQDGSTVAVNAKELSAEDASWPLVSDLFNGLAARIQNSVRELGAVADLPEQTHAEQRVAALVDDLEEVLEKRTTNNADVEPFKRRLDDIEKEIALRQDQRAQARADRLRKDNLARQDLLLAAARAHAEAGDHGRSLSVYQQLLATDTGGRLAALLTKEIKSVETRANAVIRARELCLAGRHPEARDALIAAQENPRDYLMPWKVASFPAGARAHLADGSSRVTPFEIESSFGERVELTLELEGHESLAIEADQPADRFLYFSRVPERAWQARGRVDALPVAVGDDHIVCDRSGEIARITRGGELAWQIKLASLGGVARAPVFLARKPGHLLVATEDGEVWLVDAGTGALDGPWSTGSPPIEGPVATEAGVRIRFRDGTLAVWDARLKPEIVESPEDAVATASSAEEGTSPSSESAGLAVLRRTSGQGHSLDSPWTDWSLDIGAEVFTVQTLDSAQPAFTVRRSGEWSYVAWEAPHALIPHGRLWIADGRGLRCFQP